MRYIREKFNVRDCKGKRCKLCNSHTWTHCLRIRLHRKEQFTVAKSNAKPFKPLGAHFVSHSYSKSIVLPLVTPHIVFGKSSSNERSVLLVTSLHGAMRLRRFAISASSPLSRCIPEGHSKSGANVRSGINIEPLIFHKWSSENLNITNFDKIGVIQQ